MQQAGSRKPDAYCLLHSKLKKMKKFKFILNDETKVKKITNTITLLKKGGVEALPDYMRPHKLTGNYKGHLECHILPDLLIIWLQYDEEQNEIYLVRVGSHSELFKK